MRGGGFAGWVAVGALGAFTVVGVLSIGIFVLPIFGLAIAIVVRRTTYPLDMLGFVVGIGVVLLAVTYSNTGYQPCVPGALTCGGRDPQPWLVAGWAFVGAGLAAYAALRLASRARLCRRG